MVPVKQVLYPLSLLSDRVIAFAFHMEKYAERFVYMVDYIDGFSYVEPSLHSWDKVCFIFMVDDFSDVFFDSICQYFVDYICIDVHEGYWSVILIFSCVFVWLEYQALRLFPGVYSSRESLLPFILELSVVLLIL
ncbi:hypothetical protein H671_8g19208 [Cricetulus griseus]|nr:hypothetical protein H671_8g19208 [Cricetulus griseus]